MVLGKMELLTLLFISVNVWIPCVRAFDVNVSIDTNVPVHVVNPLSPSFTIETDIFRYNWTKELRNAKFLTLVKALGPSYIRMGGTKSDSATFYPHGVDSASEPKNLDLEEDCEGVTPNPEDFERHRLSAHIAKENDDALIWQHDIIPNVTYTGSQFDNFLSFVQCVNFKLIFGLNLLKRKNDKWDSSNARELLRYAKQKRYSIDWELGNEPNSFFHKFGIRLSASEVAHDFSQLYNILQKDSWWNKSHLIGPDANTMQKLRSRKFLKKFLHLTKSILKFTTFHQYYMNSKLASISNFTDYKLLNQMRVMVKQVLKAARQPTPNLAVWVGETSSTSGGGAKGLSDTYVAGFMWLDKLGICAVNGIEAVFRQTLFLGNYALINDYFDPNPDYWLTLLYKRLVGPKVLNVTGFNDGVRRYGKVRVYAHCTNNARSDYRSGSVTLYYLNLSRRNKTMAVMSDGGDTAKRAMVYILTPSSSRLNSSFVDLNGETLQMINDRKLPRLPGKEIRLNEGQTIILPELSFGFIVLPDVKASACLSNDMQTNDAS